MEDICMNHEKHQIIYNFFGNDLTDFQIKRLQKFISDLKHEYSFSESQCSNAIELVHTILNEKKPTKDSVILLHQIISPE